MTREAVAVGPDTPFEEIVATMRTYAVGALPVLEGDGRVVGMVAEADLPHEEQPRDSAPDRHGAVHTPSDAAEPAAVTAEQLMTAPAVCVHTGTTLAQAARVMARRKVKRLPVTDAEGVLRGIVSRRDLPEAFLRRSPRRAGAPGP